MILNSDSVSSPSMGRLAALDQNARNQANQNTLTQDKLRQQRPRRLPSPSLPPRSF